MNAREVADAARRSIRAAKERLRLGEALLVFAEGTRSRTGQLQRLLSGVARYLEPPNTWVLPIGLAGTEKLFPIGEDSVNAVAVALRIGRPVQASALVGLGKGNRRVVMDAVGLAIADLLPVEYRGVYDRRAWADEDARAVYHEIFS